uniref:Uncharacterized protein n=1 Tax=Trypanosoma vivax (strain Y486) TaxID=1055687 RepID=G0TUD6_TRYVY|nr:hypothetical protein TVY486_0402360 [Trypanosoma vivax Y486]
MNKSVFAHHSTNRGTTRQIHLVIILLLFCLVCGVMREKHRQNCVVAERRGGLRPGYLSAAWLTLPLPLLHFCCPILFNSTLLADIPSKLSFCLSSCASLFLSYTILYKAAKLCHKL